MEYIDNFKRDLHNPINIKGFYTTFNNENIKDNINIKDEEALLLNEKLETKIDVDVMIKNILAGKSINTNTSVKAPINKAYSMMSDFLPFDTTYGEESNSLKKEMENLEMELLKNRGRDLLKEITILDSKFNVDVYSNIIENKTVNKDTLIQIINVLESEISSNEGRTLVQEGIIVLAGVVESYFDGSKDVFGHNVNLKGLSDNLEVSLRKRKTETSIIHRQLKESIGLGPVMQIGLDILINTASTAQRNHRGTSNVKRAVKIKKKLDEA